MPILPEQIPVRIAALEASVESFGGKVVPTAHTLLTRADQITKWITEGTIPPRPKKKVEEDDAEEGPSFAPSVQTPAQPQAGTFADLRASLLRSGEQVINQREIDALIDAADEAVYNPSGYEVARERARLVAGRQYPMPLDQLEAEIRADIRGDAVPPTSHITETMDAIQERINELTNAFDQIVTEDDAEAVALREEARQDEEEWIHPETVRQNGLATDEEMAAIREQIRREQDAARVRAQAAAIVRRVREKKVNQDGHLD